MTAFDCWWGPGAAWSVTRPCATRWNGPTICWTMLKRTCWRRCSVFAGGFDLAGAHAVGGSADEFTTLDLLDALVRKSLLVADRSSGKTRFSTLETIRQFAKEQLAQLDWTDDTRTAHARYFAGRETHVLALWDKPQPARRVHVVRGRTGKSA